MSDFTFLLDVDAPLSCGRPGCEFFEDSIRDGWDYILDGCPGCGYGAASEEDLKRGYYESQMTNLCFRCSTFYGGEYCPKCEEDLLQAVREEVRKDLIEFENEQIRFENERRARGEEDIPF